MVHAAYNICSYVVRCLLSLEPLICISSSRQEHKGQHGLRSNTQGAAYKSNPYPCSLFVMWAYFTKLTHAHIVVIWFHSWVPSVCAEGKAAVLIKMAVSISEPVAIVELMTRATLKCLEMYFLFSTHLHDVRTNLYRLMLHILRQIFVLNITICSSFKIIIHVTAPYTHVTVTHLNAFRATH